MNDDIFSISFNEHENSIVILNKSHKEIRIDIWIIDLKTNLTFKGFWAFYYPYQSTSHPFTDDYCIENSSGFIVKIFHHDALIQEKIFQFYNTDKNYFFYVTKSNEYNYPSWKQLILDKRIDVKLHENDVFYDLGSNIGVYTMWATLNNVRQIYAFEPNPILYQDMIKTFVNKNNVAIFDHAITDKFEIMDFTINSQSVSSSFHHSDGYKHSVKTINLEQFYKDKNLLKPTVIKCDIEGSEYDFIKSSSDDFIKNLRILIFEYHYINGYEFKDLAQVIKRMLSLGFTTRCIKDTNFDYKSGCIIFEKYS